MQVLIRDTELSHLLRAERALKGINQWDEVWDGIYVIPPTRDDEHQAIQARLVTALDLAVGWSGPGQVRAGVNVSDRIENWTHNYRCPDVAVFMQETGAQNCDSFWFGGPDFAVEIVTPEDSSRNKLGFYASVGVREFLIIDRAPWQLELYRLEAGRLVPAGTSVAASPEILHSQIVPLSFQLLQAAHGLRSPSHTTTVCSAGQSDHGRRSALPRRCRFEKGIGQSRLKFGSIRRCGLIGG
jgi:Uma2 family endonuclease